MILRWTMTVLVIFALAVLVWLAFITTPVTPPGG